ncbi:hypothetical protein [Spiroplasma turonicum]|uniref:Uncharacterized protein n=1 Tax=Spiroplasma turonicum TaxID=216946 RepID=A0A0K1P5Z8_9MOLU|nr:hypothetical protein [Spiroplasma turonicum]AKU79599.1 hypothetical protein STURON_00353 [Spiroplasma turonicum]ALX70621.1 hypothetical protein STURO_v1c03530 [Spiroplasma turonicum]
MFKDKSKDKKVTDSGEQAFQELLDLIFLDSPKHTSLNKEDIKSSPNKPKLDNSLEQIIKNAKLQINSVKNKCQNNYYLDPEEEIIKKAHENGKSQYDSDVLRELILNRQKNKRAINNDLSKVIDNAKNKKSN